MSLTPEDKAGVDLDANLTAAGWVVQSREDLDLTASRGIAIHNFSMKSGFRFADYLPYVDGKAIGAVAAKAEGTLTGVEAQSAKYGAGLPDSCPACGLIQPRNMSKPEGMRRSGEGSCPPLEHSSVRSPRG